MPPHGAEWMGERTIKTTRPSRRSHARDRLDVSRRASRRPHLRHAAARDGDRWRSTPTFDEEGKKVPAPSVPIPS